MSGIKQRVGHWKEEINDIVRLEPSTGGKVAGRPFAANYWQAKKD